jgi:hypothetical protein
MRDELSEYACSDGTAGNTCNTGGNNRDGNTVSGTDRTDLQYITGHKCNGLYMDGSNGLVNNIRTGNNINNSNYRRIRTEWKYNSNSIEQLRD